MEFQSVIDDHRSQVKFYRLLCLALTVVLGILAVVVPSSLKTGPYVVQDSGSVYAVSTSQPWKLTVARIEGFLKLYLTGRFDWSKETFPARKELLRGITSEPTFLKLKDSLASLEAVSKNQGARAFYVLEGYRFANEQKIIEAQVSRIIRVGTTGAVTPLIVRIYFDEAAVTEQNPYGLKVTSVEEVEVTPTTGQGNPSS